MKTKNNSNHRNFTLFLMYKILFLVLGNGFYLGFFMPFMISAKSDFTPIIAMLTIPLAIWTNFKGIKTVYKQITGE